MGDSGCRERGLSEDGIGVEGDEERGRLRKRALCETGGELVREWEVVERGC